MINFVKKEVAGNSWIYLLLFIIICFALYVRIYRTDEILGFYFDQGRDAKVIWDLWHDGKFFLIGPTTGIEGIFRGPWYYWFIAPFYLIGRGDPVWPAIFLAVTSVFSIVILYIIGTLAVGRVVGLFSAFIASFSYYVVYASRWLSNPTPMFLISMVLVLSLFLITEGKKWAWILVGLMLGFSMQFGSAAEIFYFPAVFAFAIWNRKNLPGAKVAIFSGLMFFATFLPQIIFDVRHGGIILAAIKEFVLGSGDFTNKSFSGSTYSLILSRLSFYFNIFSVKIFPTDTGMIKLFSILIFSILAFFGKELFKNKKFTLLVILFVSPLVGLLFFRGNYGNIYDYYFTGYYLIFVLIFSTVLSKIYPSFLGKIVIVFFLFIFLRDNYFVINNYLSSNINNENAIFLGNQKMAIDWVYKDANLNQFNVDAYVPPVIPHAYDYLFLWWGTTNYEQTPSKERLPLLYTLYEKDPPHPERLAAWYVRQEGIGKVEESVKFGAVTVERRRRTEQ